MSHLVTQEVKDEVERIIKKYFGEFYVEHYLIWAPGKGLHVFVKLTHYKEWTIGEHHDNLWDFCVTNTARGVNVYPGTEFERREI